MIIPPHLRQFTDSCSLPPWNYPNAPDSLVGKTSFNLPGMSFFTQRSLLDPAMWA